MSAAIIGIIAENIVILAGIVTVGHLFRQGGGWQWKTPSAPKAAQQPRGDSKAKTLKAPADIKTDVVPFEKAG